MRKTFQSKGEQVAEVIGAAVIAFMMATAFVFFFGYCYNGFMR